MGVAPSTEVKGKFIERENGKGEDVFCGLVCCAQTRITKFSTKMFSSRTD